jgi:uncharacterized membrane protein YgcG
VFAFWILNDVGIARGLDRGWNNHDILLAIDSSNGRCCLMVGYGLEELLSEAALEAIVASARPSFELAKFATGIERITDALETELTRVASTLEETHGLTPIVTAKSTPQVVAPTDF